MHLRKLGNDNELSPVHRHELRREEEREDEKREFLNIPPTFID